jgi:site-specific recombinase XerD
MHEIIAIHECHSILQFLGPAVLKISLCPISALILAKALLQKYAHRAQLDNLSPHILRHTFATHYLKANPDDLRGLAALLGHSDLNTVMIYTEPSRQDLTERLDRISSVEVA